MRAILTSLIESFAKDEETAQQARVFNILLLSFGALLSVNIPITVVLFVIEPASFGLGPMLNMALSTLVTVVSYYLSRRGHVHLAVYIFLVGIVLATTISLTQRGVANTITLVYAAISIITAGLLIQPGSALVFALFSTALYAGVAVWQLEKPPVVPYDPTGLAVYNITALTASVLVLATVTWLSTNNLRRTMWALRESEERFRRFFENELEYCYMISPEGTILDVNSTALKALGYEKEELFGKPLKMIYAPESLPKMQQLFVKWKQTGILKDEQVVIATKEGDRRTVLLSAAAVRDKDGAIRHSTSVQKDITERVRAEEALKNNQERLELITDKIPALLAHVDADQRYLYVNQAYADWYGFSKQELVGKHVQDVLPEESYRGAIKQIEAVLQGEQVSCENVGYNVEGKLRGVQATYLLKKLGHL